MGNSQRDGWKWGAMANRSCGRHNAFLPEDATSYPNSTIGGGKRTQALSTPQF